MMLALGALLALVGLVSALYAAWLAGKQAKESRAALERTVAYTTRAQDVLRGLDGQGIKLSVNGQTQMIVREDDGWPDLQVRLNSKVTMYRNAGGKQMFREKKKIERQRRRGRTYPLASLLLPAADARELADMLVDDVESRIEAGEPVPRTIRLSFFFRATLPLAASTAMGRTRVRIFGR